VNRYVLLAFGGCQRKGEQPPKASRARPKRKQSTPSPTARATIYMRDAFPARIAHYLCKEEWAFVTPLPDGGPMQGRVANAPTKIE